MRSWFMYRKNKVCQDLNRNQIGILGFSNVIPAKAGIQGSKSPVNALDPRFRGDDGGSVARRASCSK